MFIYVCFKLFTSLLKISALFLLIESSGKFVCLDKENEEEQVCTFSLVEMYYLDSNHRIHKRTPLPIYAFQLKLYLSH